MCENLMWKNITAGNEWAVDAQIKNVPTVIAPALKDNSPMTFWFMVQRPCPVCESGRHWEMFDIRWFGVEQDAWIEKFICKSPRKLLQEVKEIIKDKDVFLEIANRLGIGAVDYVA
ncbi:hypothetical protein Rctr41k_15 [Virus Rctr41k]|nr:hypothetical protein Rctr41k_15 [Virus Rctr41k]